MLDQSLGAQALKRLASTLPRALFGLLWGAAVVACAAQPAAQAPNRAASRVAATDSALTNQLEQIARPSQGKIGIAFRIIETGQAYALRGGDAFPMASVYKFPIALAVLARVDDGQLRLSDSIALTARDLSLDRSPIADHFPEAGQSLTLSELIADMIIDSDNTACDVLLKQLGGPSAVMANLVRLGVTGLRVDRDELSIAADLLNAARPGALDHPDRKAIAKLEDSLTMVEEEARNRAYASDRRDTATPSALVDLLTRFQLERTLSHASTTFLRALMDRARPLRLAKDLPPNTASFHKTGTGWGSANDVSVITLPDGRHLAVAVLIKEIPHLTLESADTLIAQAGRAIYDRVSTAPDH